MFTGNLIIQWKESVFKKKQRDSVFLIIIIIFFLGRITGINYSSAFSRIVYRWWNILYLVIHMKMDRTIIKCILIKFILIWIEGKRWILNCWIFWRNGIFVFGCSRLMVVNKMGVLFLPHLVATIISILNLFHDYVQWCWLFQIFGFAFILFFSQAFFLQNGLPIVFQYSE